MSVLLRRSFRPDATAPRLAREAVRDLAESRPAHQALELVVTELVTNSIRHAGLKASEVIEVVVDETSRGIRVEVKDSGRGRDAVVRALHRVRIHSRHDHLPTGGFGLRILAELTDRCGVRGEECTVVWFELDEAGAPSG